ncbi:unnamed protein product [Lathyrus oleraceus]
MHALVF